LSRSVYCAHPFPERNLDLHQVQGRRARLVVCLLLLGRRFACLVYNVDNGVRLENHRRMAGIHVRGDGTEAETQ
jgi:hypothetical protein